MWQNKLHFFILDYEPSCMWVRILHAHCRALHEQLWVSYLAQQYLGIALKGFLPAQGLELGTLRFSTRSSTDWAITVPLRHVQQSQQKTAVLEGLKAGDGLRVELNSGIRRRELWAPWTCLELPLGPWGLCFWAGHISVEKKSQGKIDPPKLTRLPPHPQARSKGTATNLPEKEFLPFFSMFLNEALTLLCFHRPAKIHKCWGGGGWGQG